MLTVSRSLLSIAALAPLSVLPCCSVAQARGNGDAKRPMTFADLQAMKRLSDPQISPGGHWVLFSVTEVDLARNAKTNHLWVVPLPPAATQPSDTPGGSAAEAQERQLTTGDGEASGRFSPDGRQIAFVAGDQIQLAAWDEKAGTLGRPHALTAVATGADGPVWSPDSARLLFVSSVDPSRKYPLKFLIHGGPQGAWGDAWSYRWNPELFAADGYVVLMINPRGSTGYGQRFVDGVNGDWGGKPYLDLMRGLDFAERKYPFIDRSRACALGASYGGFMADWILTHTNRFACIVTHDGMANPESAYGTTEELWFNEWEFRRQTPTGPAPEPAQPWRYAAGPAEQDPFRKWSSLRYISNAKTPTLVVHSQRDYRLDVSEGLQLFTALQRRGVPSEMLYFPDEGHWVLKPQNSELWYKTVNSWCDRWTHSNAFASAAESASGAVSSPAPRANPSPTLQPKSRQPDR